MLRVGRYLVWAFALLFPMALRAQDARQLVRLAVQTELTADRNDHSHWIYFDIDSRPSRVVKQWVAETSDGSLRRVVEQNGQRVAEADQRQRMDSFLHDSSARSRQRKGDQHDDQQATELLKLLPDAFTWTMQGTRGNTTLLHFKPNPNFRPPDIEARVFAAMEGDMAVDNSQHRIVSLKGRLIHDVKIGWGLLGNLNAGGTFDVERRETGNSVWQITETHVHIQGHALLFKTISEQEDDVKTQFRQLPASITMQQVESQLLAEGK